MLINSCCQYCINTEKRRRWTKYIHSEDLWSLHRFVVIYLFAFTLLVSSLASRRCGDYLAARTDILRRRFGVGGMVGAARRGRFLVSAAASAA